MTGVLVDSNILIDIFNMDSEWHEWSAAAIVKYANRDVLAINPIIYAEVSLRFPSAEELDNALPVSILRRDPLPWNAAFLAARIFNKYKKAGGNKNFVLPDFFIGAHAEVENMQILTRDTKSYSNHFPSVKLICPVKQ